MEIKIHQSKAEKLFLNVSKKMYGKEVDFTPLTDELSKLKKGGPLTFEHLEKIAENRIWPFHKWWRWPDKWQIEKELKETDGLFKALDGLSEIHDEREDKEKDIIEILFYKIFKHLELVSLILRFIDEENYAIYSPPVARIINAPRGYSYSAEYLNYLKELRKFREIYQVPKVAQIDMFLWAIETLGDERQGVYELFHQRLEENAKKKVVNEIIKKEILGKSDLDKARFYFKFGVYDTAAKWAGCAFEEPIHKACRKCDIELFEYDRRRTLPNLVEYLCEFIKLEEKKLKEVIFLRNKASHPSGYMFDSYNVSKMIKITESL